MDTLVIAIAKYFIIIPIAAVVAVLVILPKTEKLNFIKFLVIGGIVSLVLAKLSGLVIHDPRPFVQGHFVPLISHAADNGFPSDHTLLAAFLGFAVWTWRRYWGGLLLMVALLIGLSRMYVGIHHSWDILGSFVIAGIGAYAGRWLAAQILLPVKKPLTDKK